MPKLTKLFNESFKANSFSERRSKLTIYKHWKVENANPIEDCDCLLLNEEELNCVH